MLSTLKSFEIFREVCLNELLSKPKITTFSYHSPISNENCEHARNLIPYSLYPYLRGSALLVNLTTPNKQLPSVNFVCKSPDNVSNS